ncbi:MAG: leucine-rich repeat domain-containing protein [Clostridia bacterium]|nr:leucine-rich repeat domain-containing protein [Clostridia bacterium]
MKKLKRLFALILLCVCFVCVSPSLTSCGNVSESAPPKVDETVEGSQGLSYVLSKDKSYYVVTGMGTCTDEALVIPAEYKGLPVKEIRYDAFTGKAITSLVVSDGVEKIGEGAFKACRKLLWANIGDSVEQIDQNAFQDCNYLLCVKLPKSLKTMGKMVFFYTYRLVEIYNESSFNIYSGNDDSGARSYCLTEHKSLTEPSGLDIAENGYVTFTKGADKYFVGYLGEETTLNLPEGITRIKNYAFYNNVNLVSVGLPSSVTRIETRAFSKCNNLETLTIPAAVTYFGSNAITDSLRLESVVFENAQGWFYANSRTATEGTDVAESVLSDSASALEFLRTNGTMHFFRN